MWIQLSPIIEKYGLMCEIEYISERVLKYFPILLLYKFTVEHLDI